MNRAPHTNCTHDATKVDRRRCRTATRRALEAATVRDLRYIATLISLEGRSTLTTKDDLVEALAFRPEVRTDVAAGVHA